MTTLSNKTPYVPAYVSIEDDLRRQMQDGRLRVNSRLPGRKLLAQSYGVALSTVERAVSNLLADGSLRADLGRGTFVADPLTKGTASRTRQSSPAFAAPDEKEQAVSLPALSTTTGTLGIINSRLLMEPGVDFDSLGWSTDICASIEKLFSGAGGRTLYFDPQARDATGPVSITQAVADVRNAGVDALVVVGIYDPPAMMGEVLAATETEQVPTVYVSWEDVPCPLPHIFYDNRSGGFQACQHLLRSGYGDCLFFAPFSMPWVQERLEGAQDAARRVHPSAALRVFPQDRDRALMDVTEAGLAEAARALFASSALEKQQPRNAKPTGIVAANDYVAFAVLEAARDAGWSVGRDFGLVGFDDGPQARSLGLTSLRPPIEAMGEQAAHMVLKMLRGDHSTLQVRLRSHLISRASTCVPS